MRQNDSMRQNLLRVLTLALTCGAGDARGAGARILYRFSGGADGSQPVGPLVADRQGNLYGITMYGGEANGGGAGVVYRLAPPAGRGRWTETVLHRFDTTRGGADPNAGLLLSGDGALFGTTFNGGSCVDYCGVAFRLSPGAAPADAWHYSVLYHFPGIDASGGAPNGWLIQDRRGNLFDTTQFGGTIGCSNFPGPCGTVFELSPPAAPGGAWTETILSSFAGVPDGEFPAGGLVADRAGRLYGSTNQGGTGHCGDGEGTRIGCGTVFRVAPGAAGWTRTTLYNFTPTENNMPVGPLLFGADGALYGLATYDVFRLMPPATPSAEWTKQTIFEFDEGISGTIPFGSLVFDRAGRLFGTSSSAGLSGYSTAFMLSPPAGGTGTWSLTTLARFGRGFDTEQPMGGVLLGPGSVIYGVLSADVAKYGFGAVFELVP